MKILHVIDQLNMGGAEKVFVNLTSLLSNEGIDVNIMLFYNAGVLRKDIDKKIEVIILDRKSKLSLRILYKAHKICDNYDIVHVHMRHNYAYIRLAQFIFKGNYKLVLHDHFGNIERVPTKLKYFFKPKYFIGVSNELAQWAINSLGVKRSNAYVLPNTIVPQSNVNFVQKNVIKNILCVSNITRVKNIEFGIDLAAHYNKLTIYGNINNKEYYEELQPTIAINKNIEIVSGKDNLSDYYNNYDLAIHTSHSESGPLVLLEYLAYGIPFIAYKTGEVANTIYNDLPLHFMDSFDIEKWVARIAEIQNEKDLSTKLKNIFYKYFTPENYTKECIKIYQAIEGC